MGVDYFVWCLVEVFVFDGYVYDSYACSLYDWGAVADFWVDFNVGMLYFGFLQRSTLFSWLCLFGCS